MTLQNMGTYDNSCHKCSKALTEAWAENEDALRAGLAICGACARPKPAAKPKAKPKPQTEAK